jgi:hypothetical protein
VLVQRVWSWHSSTATCRSLSNLIVVAGVLEKSEDRSLYTHMVSEIKSLASGVRVCKFVKVDREQVRVNHTLANWARTEHRMEVWLGSGPDVVWKLNLL